MLRRIYSLRRLVVMLLIVLAIAALWLPMFKLPWYVLVQRLIFVGFLQVTIFGLAEGWPNFLDRWIARWLVQLTGVAAIAPVGAAIAYELTKSHFQGVWYKDPEGLNGFGMLCFIGIFVSPWVAMMALYRHINGEAQRQRLVFELERSHLEREASEARLRLLHSQVEPHFLFNTLANVRELVDAGAPQASTVLGHLIAYLRAAVPRIHQVQGCIGDEVELIHNYLALMHMRMPDRLSYEIHVDENAKDVICPPLCLMTLVENAVKHGIDPSEVGGYIQVDVKLLNGRCYASVFDSGIGLNSMAPETGLGCGLRSVQERLELLFCGDASVRLVRQSDYQTCANIEFPIRRKEH